MKSLNDSFRGNEQASFLSDVSLQGVWRESDLVFPIIRTFLLSLYRAHVFDDVTLSFFFLFSLFVLAQVYSTHTNCKSRTSITMVIVCCSCLLVNLTIQSLQLLITTTAFGNGIWIILVSMFVKKKLDIDLSSFNKQHWDTDRYISLRKADRWKIHTIVCLYKEPISK